LLLSHWPASRDNTNQGGIAQPATGTIQQQAPATDKPVTTIRRHVISWFIAANAAATSPRFTPPQLYGLHPPPLE
jgi:hypothetical protein